MAVWEFIIKYVGRLGSKLIMGVQIVKHNHKMVTQPSADLCSALMLLNF